VSGFFDGGEHVVADIPLVTHPVPGATGQDAGFFQAVGVMTTAVDRVGDPREASGESAGDLHIHASGLVLAGVQLRVRGPGPAGQQGAVDGVVGLRAEVVGHRYRRCQRGAQQRRQGRDGTADRGLRTPRMTRRSRLESGFCADRST
jgi:hypothetical protein